MGRRPIERVPRTSYTLDSQQPPLGAFPGRVPSHAPSTPTNWQPTSFLEFPTQAQKKFNGPAIEKSNKFSRRRYPKTTPKRAVSGRFVPLEATHYCQIFKSICLRFFQPAAAVPSGPKRPLKMGISARYFWAFLGISGVFLKKSINWC